MYFILKQRKDEPKMPDLDINALMEAIRTTRGQ
jgi:hypothetical protein